MKTPALNSVHKEKIEKILSLYKEVEAKIDAFKNATGLRCLDGCGHCCENQKLEITALEFYPLAEDLLKKGATEECLRKISEQKDKTCVFYEHAGALSGSGRCGVYDQRGLVCRLFGFFAARDKNSAGTLATCGVIKKKYPDECLKANELIASGRDVPYATDFSYRLIAIDPYLGSKYLPVNEAIRTAIEAVGLKYSCREPGEKQ